MATLIFVDKENGEIGTHMGPKDRLKVGSGFFKALDGRSQVSTPCLCKISDAPFAFPIAARKPLGTVNRATQKSVKSNGSLKQNQPIFSAKKVTEKIGKTKSSLPALDDDYPEIEKVFPFDFLEFEHLDLPEEHQIAHHLLNGMPLMILHEERELNKLLDMGHPSSTKMPSLT
ncbi:securin-like [Orycteropus afer afer]|uniref:Securin-like n=1 Tax=Orycteropus afer afer TaxID=1230840 RepID=A0AC54ZC67_ORYAF|nr:securin-like [Orycteropus afer afer]